MEFITKQRYLIKRRGGIREHIRLTYVFGKIGRDKYVRAARKEYKRKVKEAKGGNNA